MKQQDEIMEMAYFPNGAMNAPFILSNANVLLKAGEVDLALSLFRVVKAHERLAFCAHYGIGLCYLKKSDPERALGALEKALSLARRPYIAVALVNALLACGQFKLSEERSVQFAQEYAAQVGYVDVFRKQHSQSIAKSESSISCPPLLNQSPDHGSSRKGDERNEPEA
jgi:tetratricopeptide (TPR) repeat protein